MNGNYLRPQQSKTILIKPQIYLVEMENRSKIDNYLSKMNCVKKHTKSKNKTKKKTKKPKQTKNQTNKQTKKQIKKTQRFLVRHAYF